MAYTTIHNGIVFVEGAYPSAKSVSNAEIDLSFCINEQLKSLRDVKENLSMQAKAVGCNAVINFKYGQKSRFWTFDNIVFWGTGTLAVIPQNELDDICTKQHLV